MATGRCLCGAISFETQGEPLFVCHCHCESCRRQSGSIPATFVGFRSDQVEFDANVTEHNSSPNVYRGFCGTCGSALYYRHSEWNETHLYIGAFDEPHAFQPQKHVFYDEKVDGFEMHDNLARFGASGKQPIAWGPLPTENILFLDDHNEGLSAVAEAITNHLARDGKRAYSAGTDPAGSLDSAAVNELQTRGFRTEHLCSKSWKAFTETNIETLIVLDGGEGEIQVSKPASLAASRIERWTLSCSPSGSWEDIHDELERRITSLLEG
jgi:protein-tyrosine-phosphatase